MANRSESGVRSVIVLLALAAYAAAPLAAQQPPGCQGRLLGCEAAIPQHLADGQELQASPLDLIRYGRRLFTAFFTTQDGAGRPLSKGTGAPLTDPSSPLTFPRNFNRISGPEANSCAGCHNQPIAGGGGDRATEVFALAQRFDFVTFDASDATPLRGGADERGQPVTLGTIGDERKTVGMLGSGYIELLAREMTAELQRIRDDTPPGGRRLLAAKGVSFGWIARDADGVWDTSGVQGLAAPSLVSAGPGQPPSLVVRPFSQAGANVSLREFTINAFNQHMGLQAEERFGIGADPDGDGVADELTRADITAVVLFQAALPVPERRLATDPEIRRAELHGERLFRAVGCATCHVPALPLNSAVFTEPGPHNPPGTLSAADVPAVVSVNLNDPGLPGPRLSAPSGVTWVPAYTDLKLHEMCSGPNDPEREPLDQNQPAGSAAFFAGNCRFITRRLWAVGTRGPYIHNGRFTTMRAAILAHGGEAAPARAAFLALSDYDRDSIIEFLKTLRASRGRTGQ